MRMQPFLAASSFCWNCVSAFMTAGGALEQQPSLILVSSQESSACPGEAWIGVVSMVGLPLPCMFCSDICKGKLSSQNPFEIRIF